MKTLKSLPYEIYSDIRCAFNCGLKSMPICFEKLNKFLEVNREDHMLFMAIYHRTELLSLAYSAGVARKNGNKSDCHFFIKHIIKGQKWCTD